MSALAHQSGIHRWIETSRMAWFHSSTHHPTVNVIFYDTPSQSLTSPIYLFSFEKEYQILNIYEQQHFSTVNTCLPGRLKSPYQIMVLGFYQNIIMASTKNKHNYGLGITSLEMLAHGHISKILHKQVSSDNQSLGQLTHMEGPKYTVCTNMEMWIWCEESACRDQGGVKTIRSCLLPSIYLYLIIYLYPIFPFG